MYKSGSEFREFQALLNRGEVDVAAELDDIGKRNWPTLEVILCNFWCRAPDIDTESLTYIRSENTLEASTLIDGPEFVARGIESRCNWLFRRALTLSAAGFKKYQRDGVEIEMVRDKYFAEVR